MKCQPHLAGPQKGNTSHTLLLHSEGPQVETSRCEPLALMPGCGYRNHPVQTGVNLLPFPLPSCQVKQNTRNTNRIITINRLLEPDTGEPTPWHCHLLRGSRHDKVLRGLKKVWPVGIPVHQETLCSLPPTRISPEAACQGWDGGRLPLPPSPGSPGNALPTHLTNAACQGGNFLDTLKF